MAHSAYLSDANIFRKNLIRHQRAKQMGVRFYRRPSFKTPKSLVINNERIELQVPFHEKGIKYAFLDLLLDDDYCLRQLRGEDIRNVLDIGANVGFFCLAARQQFPHAEIHAYEPNPALKDYLMHQGEASKATLYFEAIGSEEKMVSLDFGEDSVHTRTVQTENSAIQQISFATAIDRFDGEVDLVKMDCEGAEWEILEDKESWKKVKRLTMEYHLFKENQTHSDIFPALEAIDFEVKALRKLRDNGMIYAERKF